MPIHLYLFYKSVYIMINGHICFSSYNILQDSKTWHLIDYTPLHHQPRYKMPEMLLIKL